MKTIEKLQNSADFNNLIYHYKCPIANVDFNYFIDTATLFGETRPHETKLDEAEKNQMDFEWKLSDIKLGGKKCARRGH